MFSVSHCITKVRNSPQNSISKSDLATSVTDIALAVVVIIAGICVFYQIGSQYAWLMIGVGCGIILSDFTVALLKLTHAYQLSQKIESKHQELENSTKLREKQNQLLQEKLAYYSKDIETYRERCEELSKKYTELQAEMERNNYLKVAVVDKKYQKLKDYLKGWLQLSLIPQSSDYSNPNVQSSSLNQIVETILMSWFYNNSLTLHSKNLKTFPDLNSHKIFFTGTWRLNYSRNALVKFPSSIPSIFPSLSDLNLSRNEISSLSPSITGFSQLTVMRLQHNRIQKLPPEIGAISLLQELDLSYNQLEELPENFGRLTQLIKLNLQSNRIKTLPHRFNELKGLMVVELSKNSLDSFPTTIFSLKNLVFVSLGKNKIMELPNLHSQQFPCCIYVDDSLLTAVPQHLNKMFYPASSDAHSDFFTVDMV